MTYNAQKHKCFSRIIQAYVYANKTMETLYSTLISPHCLTFVARWSTINLDVAQGVFADQEQLTIESLHGSTEGYLGAEWGGGGGTSS